MKPVKKFYHIVFAIIFIVELACVYFQFNTIEYIVKPAILLWIILIFTLSVSNKHAIFYFTLIGLVFSFAGDVLLMFSSKNELFFLLGIGAFLLAHIFYVFTFTKCKTKSISFLQRKPIYIIFIVVYGISLYLLLFKHLDLVLKIAVLVYTLVITSMVITALNRKDRVSAISFNLVFAGSLLFIVSDSLLSINKFWIDIPVSGILIMSTYMLAQYFIMMGLIKQSRNN